MTEIQALQAALSAEQAAVYGYGVAGALLHGDERRYALTVLQGHMVRRDALTALIAGQGARPVVARPAYRLPFTVDDATTARQLAAHLEQGVSGVEWDLVAATPAGSDLRSQAIDWLTEATLRAAHWGAKQALPGQPT